MVNIFCDTDDWSPTLKAILENNTHFNNMSIHISINCASYDPLKKYNILILQESPAVLKYRNVLSFLSDENNRKKYYKIYSCIPELTEKYDIEYMHPSNISWILNPIFLPKKTKLVSMISSNNKFLDGHKFRLNILESVKNFVDVYGRGFNPIEKKDLGLVDYYYSIAVENDDTNNYFSEKILDCFMTCTLPIYWGSEHVYNIFNPKGIINLKNINFDEIKNLTKDYYINNLDAIIENYFIAQKENRYVNHAIQIILTKLYNEKYN